MYVQSKIQRVLPANDRFLGISSHTFSSYWATVFSFNRTRTSAVWMLRRPRLCYSCCLASTGPCLGTLANFWKTPSTKWSTRTSGVTFLSFLVPYSVTSLITMSMVLVSIRVASDNFNWVWNSVTGYCAINCHLTVETWFYPRYCCGMCCMFLSRHFSLCIPFVMTNALYLFIIHEQYSTRGLYDTTLPRVSVWSHCFY